MTNKLKKLIRVIKKVGPKAAEYINKTVIPRYLENGNHPPDDLEGLFLWSESPQGNKYWRDIYLKLVEKK